MALPSWINISTGLFFTAFSLLIGLIGVAWKLGAVANGMNRAADNASELSGQLQTITDSINVEQAGSVPKNVDQMTEGMEEINESIQQLQDVDRSVNNIEAAITAVDLPGIQKAIERLFTDNFDDENLPIGNSVHYELDQSDIEVAISLAAMGENMTQVNIRFSEEVQIGSITEQLSQDEYLAELEERLFGREPQILSPSPRQINYQIRSTDMDAIADWVPEMVDRLDNYVVKTTESEKEFDEKVGEALGKSEGLED